MNLTIERDKWVRGGTNEKSELLNSRGNMCCLGFYCRTLGFKAKTILDLATPGEVANSRKNGASKLDSLIRSVGSNSYTDNRLCLYLIDANDNLQISGKTREKRVIKHFKKIGVKVEFA